MSLPKSINTISYGYPLSEFLQRKKSCLTFEAREIACHAIEVYAKRLFDKDYENLRVHSYRAAIEKIICKYWPERKHSGLKNIKHLSTFRDYCNQAVCHLEDIQIPDDEINAPDTLYNLNNWKSVVIFYTLRLMIAPLVESVILYDRTLFLLENGKFRIISFLRRSLFEFLSLNSRLQRRSQPHFRPNNLCTESHYHSSQISAEIYPLKE